MNLTDRIVDRLKNNKLIAVLLVATAVVVGTVTFFDKILSFREKHLASDVVLASLSLSEGAAAIFNDGLNVPCTFEGDPIRTFAPKDERKPSTRLDLAATFTNRSGAPVVVSAAVLEVAAVERMAGGGQQGEVLPLA